MDSVHCGKAKKDQQFPLADSLTIRAGQHQVAADSKELSCSKKERKQEYYLPAFLPILPHHEDTLPQARYSRGLVQRESTASAVLSDLPPIHKQTTA